MKDIGWKVSTGLSDPLGPTPDTKASDVTLPTRTGGEGFLDGHKRIH